MDNWDDIDEINEQLGQSLDLDSAWDEFNGRKKKRRAIWWLFPFGVLFLVLPLYLVFSQPQNMDVAEQVADSGDEITSQRKTIISEEVAHLREEASPSEVSLSSQNYEGAKRIMETEDKETLGDIKAILENKEIIDNEGGVSQYSKSTKPIIIEKEPDRSPLIESKNSSQQDSKIQKSTESLPVTNWSSIGSLKSRALYVGWSGNRSWDLPSMADFIPSQEEIVKEKFPWTIGVAYAISKSSRSELDLADAFDNRRHEKETFLENNSLEISFQKRLSPRWGIQTGIVIDQTRAISEETINSQEVISLEDQVVSVDVKEGVIESSETGPVNVSVINSVRYVRYHYYRNISVPLQVNYQVFNSEKWGLELGGSAQYQLLGTVRGETFDSHLPDGKYKDLSTLGFRQSGLLQGRAEVNLARSFSERMQVQLGVRYLRDLNSRRSNSSQSEVFSKLGLHMGMYWEL